MATKPGYVAVKKIATDKKVADNSKTSLSGFIHDQVAPISRAFSQTPLTRLRLKTPQGALTLVKLPQPAQNAQHAGAETAEASRPLEKVPHAARMHNPMVGRAYDTISADVVGIFRDLPEPPGSGERLNNGQVLGHIEALRLRNAVRCPVDCTLIAQVVVDGQAVDFGETLFVVDSAGALVIPDTETLQPAEILEPSEPPRL